MPGWAHDITNVGDDEIIVMLWANEIFDRARPDTSRNQGGAMKKLKVITVVGTRPEIIRLSRVLVRLDEHCEHVLVHTGQNYDYELNQVFFEDLGMRKPDHFLNSCRRHRGARPSATSLPAVDAVLRKGAARSAARSRRHQQLPRGDRGKAPQDSDLSHGGGQSLL